MNAIRQAFASHSETVRDYFVALIEVDSGIYNIAQLKTILEAPDSTIRMETEWLQSLLEAIRIIQKYIRLVERWVEHTMGLAKNLGATQSELIQLERFEIRAAEMVKSKDFDQKYLRWVLEDAAQELDRLIVTAHELLHAAPRLIELTEKFQGPFFFGTQQIAKNWEEHSRREFLIPLSTILQELDTTGDKSVTLQQFGQYLDTILQVVNAMPVLVIDSSAISTYSPQALQSNLGLIQQLIDGAEHLQQFIQIRSQVFSVLVNEQTALWNAVLPPDTPVAQVLITLGLNPSQETIKLLPNPIPTDTLSLALKQAEEALTIWDISIEASMPYLNKALVLNQILQSPTIAKFLQADQQRMQLYHEWRPRITATLESLRNSIDT